ncbi:unnamed protein product, partial [Laminaria digitata]
VVIDFHATWCGPCKRVAPFLAKLSESMAGAVVFIKVSQPILLYSYVFHNVFGNDANPTPLAPPPPERCAPKVDVDEHSEASEKYEIEAMPTFKFVKNGVVLATITGADEASIEAAANQHK